MSDEQIKSLGKAITRQHAVAEQLAARVMQMDEVNAELLEFAQEVRRAGDTRLANMAIAAIARAESAIETPAKVSPCAGHAVQLPDPLGVLSCTHPDCGRYEGPRSHECRAMADNACARPSICQGHAVQQEADDLVGLRGCNSRHLGRRTAEPCIYRMRTTDFGCTGCMERDDDQPAEAGD